MEIFQDGIPAKTNEILSQLEGEIKFIPEDMASAFAPAKYWLYEWQDYFLELSSTDQLRVGTIWPKPIRGNLFCLCFKNHLGLTSIQSFMGQQPRSAPLHVEVISRKFPDLQTHLSFSRALLGDLFARAARLPFTISAETGRGVTEAQRPPAPLFTLHFLCQYLSVLRTSLFIIQEAPHRILSERSDLVPLAESTEADADVLFSILHSPERWVPAQGFPLATRLNGYAPSHVWQRLSEETFDTPENRFALAFMRELLIAAESLPSQPWWPKIPPERQSIVTESANILRQIIAHPMFAAVGPLQLLPLSSQVLLRRQGYSDLLGLWQKFHLARQPLFELLRHAIELRDIATLYETWVFFTLVEEIAVITGERPRVELQISQESGLGREAVAIFGQVGQLKYNTSPRSYSVPLRPDFSWCRGGKTEIVLDAKFRLEHQVFESLEDEDSAEATARHTDLYKMHTYRDALGVRAAISLYPGDVSTFYDCDRQKIENFTLRQVIMENLAGIGALAMRPGNI